MPSRQQNPHLMALKMYLMDKSSPAFKFVNVMDNVSLKREAAVVIVKEIAESIKINKSRDS